MYSVLSRMRFEVLKSQDQPAFLDVQLKGVKVKALSLTAMAAMAARPPMTAEMADTFVGVCSVLMSQTASRDELLELSKTEQYDKASKLSAERIQIVRSVMSLAATCRLLRSVLVAHSEPGTVPEHNLGPCSGFVSWRQASKAAGAGRGFVGRRILLEGRVDHGKSHASYATCSEFLAYVKPPFNLSSPSSPCRRKCLPHQRHLPTLGADRRLGSSVPEATAHWSRVASFVARAQRWIDTDRRQGSAQVVSCRGKVGIFRSQEPADQARARDDLPGAALQRLHGVQMPDGKLEEGRCSSVHEKVVAAVEWRPHCKSWAPCH